MKKFLVAAIAVLGVTFTSQAQTTTTLNVKLHPIQTLVVNPAQNQVDLDYHSTGDYLNGVVSTQQDHLSIYSTGGFQVKVKSASNNLESGSNAVTSTLAANTIQILASNGTEGISEAEFSSTELQDNVNEGLIIKSLVGGVDKTFNIEYKGAGANQYVNLYNSAENPTVYSTVVTYTITAL
jgi:hypothetical protein